MKKYKLSENEVVLFRGVVSFVNDWDELNSTSTYNTELLLTNINFVLMTENDLVDSIPQIFSVNEIKVYDNKIQILRKKNTIEIYHKSGEIYLKFELEKNAKEFCDKVLKIHSGYTKFVRSVKTAEKVIKDNTEPLGINAKQTAKVVCSAVTTYVSSGKKSMSMAVKAVSSAIQNNAKTKEQAFLPEEEVIEY